MVNGSTLNRNMKKVLVYRGYTETGDLSATQYNPPSQFKISINNSTPNIDSTDLDYVIPIGDGTTNDDGSNTLTGSGGGDNSTDNTDTYKEGAGNTDATAQNLIANNTSTLKTWTISNLASAGNNITATQPFSIWLYIKDTTALDKFKSSSTAISIRLGSDSSNYYFKNFEKTDLTTGWNWLSSGTDNVDDLPANGTPGSPLDTFAIVIITNNATDAFVAGDVVYDLLRQWEETDLVKDLNSGFPSIDLTTQEATSTGEITSLEANGFLISGHALFNEDTTPLMLSEDTFEGESKSNTDTFKFTSKDRVI